MSDEDNSYNEFMQHVFIFSITIEAEGRREGTQHGVRPCLSGGEGWRSDDCTVLRRAARSACHVVMNLLPHGHSAASSGQNPLDQYQNNRSHVEPEINLRSS
jgi:hypothetical protein